MGRPRKPTALKKTQGTLRKSRQLDMEVEANGDVPSPPGHLQKRELEIWNYYVPRLHMIGCISSEDRDVFAEYCEMVALAERAKSRAMKDAEYYITKTGYIQQSGYLSLWRSARRQAREVGARFGITPSHRSNIASNVKSDNSFDEDFVFGGLKVVEKK